MRLFSARFADVRFAMLTTLVLCALCMGAPAMAEENADESTDQDTTSSANEQLARDLFLRAREAREGRQLGLARNLLRESLRVHPAASTAYNLAGVLVDTGEYIEAIELCDRLLGGEFGELPDDRANATRTRRTQAAGNLATLRIDTVGHLSEVEIDGALRSLSGAPPYSLQVNPGRRRVIITLDGHRHAEQVDLLPSGLRTIQPMPRPTVQETPFSLDDEATTSDDEPRQRRVVESPWFWAALGALVLGGVVTGVVLGTSRDADRVSGTVFPEQAALSSGGIRFP